MVPTKRGVGVQIWGTYDDLDFFRGGPTEKTDRPLFNGRSAIPGVTGN